MSIPGGTYGKVALALGLVVAAYMAETIRAGIQAVPKGQMEAARSLGFSPARAMISIIIPQAFRIILPPLTNELVLLFKDSSLVLFLGVTLEERELSKFGRDLASTTANSTPILVAGLCYLLVTIPLGFVVRRMEAKAQEADQVSRPEIASRGCTSPSATTRSCAASTWRSARARSSASSARPAPASRPCCAA